MQKLALLGAIIIQLTFVILLLASIDESLAAEKPGPIMEGEQHLPDEALAPEYDYSGQNIQVNITVYDTQQALNEAFVAAFKDMYYYLPEVWGFFKIVKGVCTIHVLKLKDVAKDPQLSVWGHEMAHCIYGRYHQ